MKKQAALTKEEMAGLKLEGYTYGAIGVLAGVTRQRVQQILAPPWYIRDLIVSHFEGKCVDCGLYVSTKGHLHHKNSNTIIEDYTKTKNLELLCASCHHKKHKKEIDKILGV